MTKQYLFLITILFGLNSQLFAQQSFNPDQALEALVSEEGNIGVSAGYSINGEIKWSNSEGYACLDDKVPFSVITLTRIASISKSMTAVAVMQLAEQNLINLDVPIQTYLPDFPNKMEGDITIRQLLAHTAGIPQYDGEKEIENSIYFPTLQDAMNVFIDRPLLFKPGTKHFYSTYGYVILGRIIEEVSGVSFEEYMQTNIWDVAEMHNTGVELINSEYSNKSCLYYKARRRTRNASQNDLSNRVPGGGFYSTLEDVLKFGDALLQEKLIRQETFQQMLESQPVEYDGNKYGFGWYFYAPAPNENLVIGHSGTQTGSTSQLMIIPRSNTVVVVLSNTSRTYPEVVTFASGLIGHSELGKE
tara:strand:+ start:8327 stop:9406 length:1080 start_codon:yes stop_codon:yes gene_type:complete